MTENVVAIPRRARQAVRVVEVSRMPAAGQRTEERVESTRALDVALKAAGERRDELSEPFSRLGGMVTPA